MQGEELALTKIPTGYEENNSDQRVDGHNIRHKDGRSIKATIQMITPRSLAQHSQTSGHYFAIAITACFLGN